jgi:hypothetical protein
LKTLQWSTIPKCSTGGSMRLIRLPIDMNDDGSDAPRLFLGVIGVGEHEDDVAGVDQSSGGAVYAAFAAAACAGEGVSGKPVAVIDVEDVDLLVLDDVGGFEELRVEGDAAHIVEVSLVTGLDGSCS